LEKNSNLLVREQAFSLTEHYKIYSPCQWLLPIF
jgi:hypothetical protein